MRRGARFNIIHQTSKANCWGFQEEGEEQGQAGRSREWGDRRGQAEVGGKTTETHLKDPIRGETFVQKDLVYGVDHACAARASKPVW